LVTLLPHGVDKCIGVDVMPTAGSVGEHLRVGPVRWCGRIARLSLGDDAQAYLWPVVQDNGVQIGPVRPLNGSGVWIDLHLGKKLFVL